MMAGATMSTVGQTLQNSAKAGVSNVGNPEDKDFVERI